MSLNWHVGGIVATEGELRENETKTMTNDKRNIS